MSFINSIFDDFTSDDLGGVLIINAGNLKIINCRFINCSAKNHSGTI